MTDERIMKYLEQNLCVENPEVLGVEETSTERLVYVLVKNFNRKVLRKIRTAGLSFSTTEKFEDGYKVLCYFIEDLIEYGVRVEMGAYNTREFIVLEKPEKDNDED